MLRNTIAIILGLFVALLIITIGITINKTWFEELDFINLEQKQNIYRYWRHVVIFASKNLRIFFFALLVSTGIGAIVGGVVTAIIVKTAKQAYALFIGFLLMIFALLDVIFTPSHPTWYELSVVPVLFFFSWLGGKIVDVISSRP